jgi:hypothetical protein
MGNLFSYCTDFTEKENKIIDDKNIEEKYIDFTQQRSIDIYKVDIDFDEASLAWRNNKLNFACCNYVYICTFIKDGKKCGRRPYNGKQFCTIHSNFNKK